MKLVRGLPFLSVLVLSLGVLAGSASLAHAQEIKGKFSLPNETHWGPAVLPSGDYVFSLDSADFPARVTVMKTTGSLAAVVLAMTKSSAGRPYGVSQLMLERRGDELFVSSMYIKDLDLELLYSVPKASEETVARNTAKLQTPVVSGAAK
jgi:hypothetical protein